MFYLPKAFSELGTVHRILARNQMHPLNQQLSDWREARDAALRAISEWRLIINSREKHPYANDLARAEALLAESEAHLK
jgi:hypothetical protein